MDTRKLISVVAVLIGCFAGAPARAETEVVGNIPFPVTWTAENSPYLLTGDVKVLNQATLIIEPGVEVRYAADDLLAANEDPDGVELIIEGILIAEGTAEAPILFTGQGDSEPAAHATGIRLAGASGASSIVYSEFAGLANAIDIQSYTPVILENITITEAINGVMRSSTVQAFTLVDCDIMASGHALDMSAPDAGVGVTIEGTAFDGNVRIEGDLLAGSDLTIAASTFAGRFWLKGTAGSDSQISISNSDFDGTVFIGNYGRWYLGSSPKNWEESVSTCTAQGLALAELVTDEELLEFQRMAVIVGAPLWVGATKNTNYKCNSTYNNNCLVPKELATCVVWQSLGYSCGSYVSTNCVGNSEGHCSPTAPGTNGPVFANSWRCSINSCAYSDCPPGELGNWYWNSGEPWSFSNWAPNQSLKCQDDRAVALLLDGTWFASEKASLRPFLCIGEAATNDPDAQTALSISNVTVAGSLSIVAGPTQVSGLLASGMQYLNTTGDITITGSELIGYAKIETTGNVTLTHSEMEGHFRAEAAKTDLTYNWFNGEAGLDRIHITGPLNFNSNIVTNAGYAGLRLSTGGSEVPSVIAYNTFVDNASGIVVDGDTGAGSVSVSNNIVIRGAGTGIQAANGAALTVSHNNVWEYATAYDGVVADVNASSYNPLFIQDLPSDEPNFALQSFSPLIDIGTCEEAFETDFNGMPRPFDGDFDGIAKCDVGAYEFGPETMYITGDKDFGTGQETNLVLMGVSGGFEYPLAGAAFTVTPEAGIYEPGSQRYRPTHLPGTYEGAITAVFGGIETVLDLDLQCGCKTPDYPDGTPGECNGVPDCYYVDWDCEVRDVYCEPYDSGVLPDPVTAYVKQQLQLRGGGRDAFGFVFGVEGLIDYDVVSGGGTVSETGEFVAGITTATFPDSLKTDWNGLVGYTDIIVGSGAPATISVAGPSSPIPTTQQGQYSAVVYDDEGNVVEGANVQWHIEGGVDAEVDLLTGVVTAGCTPGTYPDAVVATLGLLEQAADLVVVEGGAVPESIAIEPVAASIPAMTSTTFVATVFDGCGAQITDGIIFSADAAAGIIDAETGEFTAGCNEGEHAQAVTATYGGMNVTAAVTVTGGALGSLELTPSQAQVDTTSNTLFTVSGHDVCGKPMDVAPVWSTTAPNGTLVDGPPDTKYLNLECSQPGIYTDALQVIQDGVTAAATVEVLPGTATTLSIVPGPGSVPAGGTLQLGATATDDCGNDYSEYVEWEALSGGTIDAAGLFSAGCVKGGYADAVKVSISGLEAFADITVVDAQPQIITISPEATSTAAMTSTTFTATVFDGCGVQITDGIIFSANAAAGVIDAETGEFTAGCNEGEHAQAVTASYGDLSASADVTITAGALGALYLNPEQAQVETTSSTSFTVSGTDVCGNPMDVVPAWSTGIPDATLVEDQPGTRELTLNCAPIGTYENGVLVTQDGVTAQASIEVLAGASETLTVEPMDVDVPAGGATQFVAVASDSCGNDLSDLVEWAEISGGTVDDAGLFTASCVKGSFPTAVSASVGDLEVYAGVTIGDGVLAQIVVEPPILTLPAGSSGQLDVTLLDACGNPVAGAVSFNSASGGTIDGNGLVTAGTVAGTWQDAVTVSSGNQSAKVTLIVTPGAAMSLVLSPDPIVTVAAGSVQVAVEAEDAYGNEFVPDVVDWSADEQAGNIDMDGVFTAGTVAGDYANGVSATVGGVSTYVDVLVEPGEASDIVVTPASPIVLTPTATAQLSAVVEDEYGNEVDTPVTWSMVSGGGTVNATGLLTAGPVTGTFEDTLRAATEGIEVFLDVTVVPGPPTELENIIPQSATLQPNGQQLFVTTVMDAWGNDTGLAPQWSVVAGGGSIVNSGNDAGLFTAGEDVGTFPQTVRAKYGTISVFADVTVVAGEVAQVMVTPGLVSMAVNQSVEFTAEAFDAFNNPLDMNATWSLAPGTNASINQLGVLTLGCGVEPGYHPELVKASVLGIVGSADVEVTAGDTVYISMGSPFEEVPVMGQAMLTATAQDACGNATGSLLTWLLPEGGGSISPTGLFTADTVAGTYPVKATANGVEGQMLVAVLPGEVDSIALSPQEATVAVGGTASFEVEAADQFGNAWQPEDVLWEAIPEAGEIDDNGGFTAGIVAGDYLNAVVASLDGKSDTADVFIIPGEAEVVEIAPLDPTVFVGQELQFSATVLDGYGNTLTDADCTFECSADVGDCTEGGLLTACLVPGEYEDAVTASYGVLSVSTDVIVVAGAPSVIEITPSSATSAIGTTVEFSAQVFDDLDILIEDAVVTWSADPDLGVVDVAGVLEIGTTPGEYQDGVVASIGDVEGYADVTVPVDFDEDGMADVDELAYGFDPLDELDVLADPDEDGLSSIEEYVAGIDPTDADSDDDGVLDGQEPKWSEDSDGDGLINAADPDSDDDGILDGTEAGVTEVSADTDESSGNFMPDADPATKTDPLKDDTDDDGISDGTEDSNYNGALDPGETDPNDATNLTACDTDGDCPEGEYCAEDGFCYLMDAEPTPDTGVIPDAGPDRTEVTSEDVVTVPGPSSGASGCAAAPAGNADPQAAFLIFLAMLTLVFIIPRRSRHRR